MISYFMIVKEFNYQIKKLIGTVDELKLPINDKELFVFNENFFINKSTTANDNISGKIEARIFDPGLFLILPYSMYKKYNVIDSFLENMRTKRNSRIEIKEINTDKNRFESEEFIKDVNNALQITDIHEFYKLINCLLIIDAEKNGNDNTLIVKYFNLGGYITMNEDVRKELYNQIIEKCTEEDFEKAKNLFDKGLILKYPDRNKNILEYINENLTNNSFHRIIEQLSIIISKLKSAHDFNKGKISEIILKKSNNSLLLAFKFGIAKTDVDNIIIFNGIQSKEMSSIERLFNKSFLVNQTNNIDSEIEEGIVKSSANTNSLNRYLKSKQDSINLINICKKEGRISIDRFDYFTSIMEPSIFDDTLELFYIDDFKEVLIRSLDNYFYINRIFNKKEQELYIFNIKTIISDTIFRNILSKFDK